MAQHIYSQSAEEQYWRSRVGLLVVDIKICEGVVVEDIFKL